MMTAPYASAAEYRALCPAAAAELTDAEIERQLSLASDDIDALCYGRVRRDGFGALTSFQQEKIRRAACLHAAFLATYGEALHSPLDSYALGEAKIRFDRAMLETLGGVTTSCEVTAQLRQTGLALRRLE